MTIIIMYIIITLLLIASVFYLIHRLNKPNVISPNEFLGLLSILSSQIQTELDAYDQDIFENKGSITNNNFDNYYQDLTHRILRNISPNMIHQLSQYYTEEAIYRFIGRSVRDYLVSKIKGTT